LEFRKNPLADKASACACAAARWIQKQGAEVLICADIGRRAAQRLNESGIRVLHAQTGELDTLLSDYRRGRWEQTAPSGHGIPESCPSQRQGHDGRHPHSCGGGRHHGHPRRGAGQGHGYAHAQRGCHH
jgi:predicted Fe-Mo cluster-binding NifX family protein